MKRKQNSVVTCNAIVHIVIVKMSSMSTVALDYPLIDSPLTTVLVVVLAVLLILYIYFYVIGTPQVSVYTIPRVNRPIIAVPLKPRITVPSVNRPPRSSIIGNL